MSPLLWQPTASVAERTAIARFSTLLAQRLRRPELEEYTALHRYSVTEQGAFWQAFVTFSGIEGEGFDGVALEAGESAYRARYFPEARLNLAENLLVRNDDAEAILFRAEDRCERRLSWRSLQEEVSRMQQALAAAGLKVGDRIAAVIPNCPEAVIGMLATQSLGGVWSSCSPDFGVRGILERFSQIEPRFLICTDGYWYNGKSFALAAKIAEVRESLPSLERVIVAPLLESGDVNAEGVMLWDDFIADFPAAPCHFVRLPFDHPAFILFSSGTTGKPKCFLHGQGAYLLGNRLDLMLHNDVRNADTTCFFTTCGWMMWNWLVGALGLGSRVVLYDGSPFAEGVDTLFDLADREGFTFLGISPKLLSVLEKEGGAPGDFSDFPNLRRIASTGSPLSAGNFRYVYQKIKANLHLASISGGTDILGCFLGGHPAQGVYEGEMQVALLGKDVMVMEEDGTVCQRGIGDLVCRVPFLGMPLGFWGDPEHVRYHETYFACFSGFWCHGDYLEHTDTGYIIHGRSDTVLNPGGVRIGTAEIYHAIENIRAISDAIAIGQSWNGDVRIVLFLVLAQGCCLDDALRAEIRQTLKIQCSPRHIPAKILEVAEIPRTRSGKISEKAVSDMVHGRTVRNHAALDNPESLTYFAERPELCVD